MGKETTQHRGNATTLGNSDKRLDSMGARQGIDFEAVQGG
jgi:hypothetical protein